MTFSTNGPTSVEILGNEHISFYVVIKCSIGTVQRLGNIIFLLRGEHACFKQVDQSKMISGLGHLHKIPRLLLVPLNL